MGAGRKGDRRRASRLPGTSIRDGMPALTIAFFKSTKSLHAGQKVIATKANYLTFYFISVQRQSVQPVLLMQDATSCAWMKTEVFSPIRKQVLAQRSFSKAGHINLAHRSGEQRQAWCTAPLHQLNLASGLQLYHTSDLVYRQDQSLQWFRIRTIRIMILLLWIAPRRARSHGIQIFPNEVGVKGSFFKAL